MGKGQRPRVPPAELEEVSVERRAFTAGPASPHDPAPHEPRMIDEYFHMEK